MFSIFVQVITWFGEAYAFHIALGGLLSVDCPKPSYADLSM
jgi:hypothetical protein